MAKKYENVLKNELISKKVMTKDSADKLLKEAERSGMCFVAVLVKYGISSEAEILGIISEKMDIPYMDLNGIEVDKTTIEKIPIKLASYYRIMPLSIEDRTLTIAVSHPFDVKTLDDLRLQLGYDIKIVLATSEDIGESAKRSYGLGAETLERIMSKVPEARKVAVAREEKVEDIAKVAGDVSVVKLVNQIILEAYKKRATDIHIEPYRGKVNFRYRIDGVLYNANVPDEVKNFLQPILSRIKIMSNLNIVERRLPQDGRAIVKVQDKTLDLRISFIPTPFGESVVIRILPTTMFFDLVKLGLSEDQLDKFESFIKRPHGIIFVTGPTGSGKTTTLYACLSRMNTHEKKIITIEDPIEYEMSGITQIQVAGNIGLDFARGLRSMLRHDPDVMMVGEVRDLETAEKAIRVALTGHLVLSTLHTNDAASGIMRLIEIGVEPFLILSSVVAFVAQRLIRVNCTHCRKECTDYPPEIKKMIVEELGLRSEDEVKIIKGEGCSECNFTGYYGRTAIYEILSVDEKMQDLIMKKASIVDIRNAAKEQGMRSLRQDGWMEVLKGITTPDEVLRVTQREEGVDSCPEKEESYTSGKNIEKVEEMEEKPVETKKVSGQRPCDKRIYMRLDDKINVRFRLLKDKRKGSLFEKKDVNPEQISSTKNVSAGGLLFSSNEAPPLDVIIEIKLEAPSRNESIDCLARVVRVETVEVKKNYNVAVAFLDISSKDRAYLDRYTKTYVT
ncbi:MAG: Flp pilus assembly complex ATPase component TadA [Candidatus Omnitrophica bacterium]|nr:Flp pilus assembly complex ATPase component TadA [Candidatus Omnitrophota bacterium]